MTISISALPYTVSVLGSAGVITVDISNAALVNEEWQPISLGDLVVGQFAELTLTSNVPATTGVPFTASVVKSMVPGTLVYFGLFDRHGKAICDNANDISASVTFSHPGKATTKAAAKPITLRTTTSGQFGVANIPPGQAKVSLTRVNSGKKSTASSAVKVVRKTTQNFRMTLN
jgi:hypothetical protein